MTWIAHSVSVMVVQAAAADDVFEAGRIALGARCGRSRRPGGTR